MLNKPDAGWCELKINNEILCYPSYQCDAPIVLLSAFMSYFSGKDFHAEFDCETYRAALVIINDRLCFVDEAPVIGALELKELDIKKPLNQIMYELAKELVNDLENIELWLNEYYCCTDQNERFIYAQRIKQYRSQVIVLLQDIERNY